MSVLSDELSTDPLDRGYSGMTDAEAAVDLNTAYRSTSQDGIEGSDVWSLTSPAEFKALKDGGGVDPDEKAHWMLFCLLPSIGPNDAFADQFVQDLFGAGSDTYASFSGIKTEPITRGQEIGFGKVAEGDVTMARKK